MFFSVPRKLQWSPQMSFVSVATEGPWSLLSGNSCFRPISVHLMDVGGTSLPPCTCVDLPHVQSLPSPRASPKTQVENSSLAFSILWHHQTKFFKACVTTTDSDIIYFPMWIMNSSLFSDAGSIVFCSRRPLKKRCVSYQKWWLHIPDAWTLKVLYLEAASLPFFLA